MTQTPTPVAPSPGSGTPTGGAGPVSEPTRFDGAQAYQQSPEIGLRPEPFGALAYHFVTRRLVFLKSILLVELVEALAEHSSADDAIDAVIEPPDWAQRRTYHQALGSLVDSGVIVGRSVPEVAATTRTSS